MSKDPIQNYTPLPKDTRAFICALCGAVSLDPNNICKVQGLGTKADWCGTSSHRLPLQCINRVHTNRWVCNNCRQVSMNPELLCEPEKMKP